MYILGNTSGCLPFKLQKRTYLVISFSIFSSFFLSTQNAYARQLIDRYYTAIFCGCRAAYTRSLTLITCTMHARTHTQTLSPSVNMEAIDSREKVEPTHQTTVSLLTVFLLLTTKHKVSLLQHCPYGVSRGTQ